MAHLRSFGTSSNLVLPSPEFREDIIKIFWKTIVYDFIKNADYNLCFDYVIVDEAHKETGRDNAKLFFAKFIKNIKKV